MDIDFTPMPVLPKAWYESRTLWLAIIQGVIGIVAVVSNEHPQVGTLLIAKSVLDIILRMLTETPIE